MSSPRSHYERTVDPRHPRPPGWSRTGYDLGVSDHQSAPGTASSAQPLQVLVYSDNERTRAEVLLALGTRPHPDLPPVQYVECATEPVVIQHMDARTIDLAILDGESAPVGGMGIARQLKDEIAFCPPLLVLTGRPQDAWLATWSNADAVVPHPIDAMQLAEAVIELLRPRVAASVTR